jgi:hypothetical protein
MSVNLRALLNRCTRKLEIAFEDDGDILRYLLSRDLISQPLFNQLSEPVSLLTSHDKAVKLVKEIKGLVELDSRNYPLLVEYLEECKDTNGKYASILRILSEEQAALEGKAVTLRPAVRPVEGKLSVWKARCFIIGSCVMAALAVCLGICKWIGLAISSNTVS